MPNLSAVETTVLKPRRKADGLAAHPVAWHGLRSGLWAALEQRGRGFHVGREGSHLPGLAGRCAPEKELVHARGGAALWGHGSFAILRPALASICAKATARLLSPRFKVSDSPVASLPPLVGCPPPPSPKVTDL